MIKTIAIDLDGVLILTAEITTKTRLLRQKKAFMNF